MAVELRRKEREKRHKDREDYERMEREERTTSKSLAADAGDATATPNSKPAVAATDKKRYGNEKQIVRDTIW